MKRVGNLYSQICNKNNVRKAILNASKGKKSRPNVKRIVDNINFYVEDIHKMLSTKEIKFSPYKKMTIHDGTNKKERIIYKPKFYPDQIIHWCLMQIIEPYIIKGMYDYSCASIPDRGIHYGAKYIKRIIVNDRKNTKYCLKLDIHHFYPSIDKEICKKKFRKIIKDNETLELIDKIIDSNQDGGLPIGNYTSQWFANFYLQDLDHYIKEQLKVKYYIRYMDDMVLFHRNKKELHKIRISIENYLNNEKLELKGNWQLFKLDSRGLDFLGYRFFRGYTKLRRGNFLRIKRRIKRIAKRGKIRLTDAYAMISYNGWLKHCDSHNFKEKYVKPYISIKKCKGVIKNAYRKQYKTFKQF